MGDDDGDFSYGEARDLCYECIRDNGGVVPGESEGKRGYGNSDAIILLRPINFDMLQIYASSCDR